MAGPLNSNAPMSTLDYYISLTFGTGYPDFRQSYELVEAEPHASVQESLRQVGTVESISSPSINSAAVFIVDAENQDLTVFLCSLLPYAAIVRRTESGEPSFLTDSSDETAVDIVVNAGFILLSEERCRALSQLRDPVTKDAMTIFEVLFEHNVDPPWEWASELEGE